MEHDDDNPNAQLEQPVQQQPNARGQRAARRGEQRQGAAEAELAAAEDAARAANPVPPAPAQDDDDDDDDDDAQLPALVEDPPARDDVYVPPVPKNAIPMPSFKGSPAEAKNVTPFLVEFESYCEWFNVNDAKKLILLRHCFPVGSISRVWYDKNARTGAFITYSAFKAQFKSRFGLTPADAQFYLRKLDRMRQDDKTPITLHYEAFNQLLADLSLGGHDFTDQQEITAFVRTLRREIRDLIGNDLVRNPSLSIDEIVNLARGYEHNLFRKEMKSLWQEEYKNHREGVVDLRLTDAPDSDDEGTRTRTSNITCGFCKRQGHKFDDCPKVIEKKKKGTWQERGRK